MLRSILAIVAGSFTWMVTALGMDVLVRQMVPGAFASGRVDSVPLLLFMGGYSLAFGVLAGYVTGLIARRAETKHAVILGVVQLAMGIGATVINWNTAPAWYHVAFLSLVLPSNMLGGMIRERQRLRSEPPALASA